MFQREGQGSEWDEAARRSCRMRAMPTTPTMSAPAVAAMSSTTAVGALPCSHKKFTDECWVFCAMKITSRTRTNAATTTAVQLALTRVRRAPREPLDFCCSSVTFDIGTHPFGKASTRVAVIKTRNPPLQTESTPGDQIQGCGRISSPVLAGVVPWLLTISLVQRNGKVVLLSWRCVVRGDIDELRHAGQLRGLVPCGLTELKTAHVGAARRDGPVVAARLDPEDALKERGKRGVPGSRARGGSLSRGHGGRGRLCRACCRSARRGRCCCSCSLCRPDCFC